MAVVLGGVGSVHDALLAAALRSRHIDAVPIAPPDRQALEKGRRVLARGYPATMYFLAGALAKTVASIRDRAGSDEPIFFVTAGGHCSHYASDYRLAMDAAGYDDVCVLAPSIAAVRANALDESLASVFTDVARPLLRACIAGDVLVRLGNLHRVRFHQSAPVDALLDGLAAELASALEEARPTRPAFERMRHVLGNERDSDRSADLVRVRITGEFFPTITSGPGSHRIVRWLESRGALVETPTLTDWILYALWQLTPVLGQRSDRVRAVIRKAFERLAAAAGLEPWRPEDPATLAKAAAPHIAPDVRGSAGHLEVGTYLLADRRDRADLVVSLKAFASTPSSSVSDGVLHTLSQRRRTGFVSVEVNGDAELQATSRLELALDLARKAKALRRRAPRATTGTGRERALRCEGHIR